MIPCRFEGSHLTNNSFALDTATLSTPLMLSRAAVLLVAISSASAQLATSTSIQAVISSNTALTQLNSLLVQNTAALSALAIPNAHTIFAPTNEAFNEFYSSNPNANASMAEQFLNYHIIVSR